MQNFDFCNFIAWSFELPDRYAARSAYTELLVGITHIVSMLDSADGAEREGTPGMGQAL